MAQQQAQHPQQPLMYPLRQETKQQVAPDAPDGIVSLASGTAAAQRATAS